MWSAWPGRPMTLGWCWPAAPATEPSACSHTAATTSGRRRRSTTPTPLAATVWAGAPLALPGQGKKRSALKCVR